MLLGPYEKPKDAPLAVKGKIAKSIGRTAVFIKVERCPLLKEETVGIIKDPLVNAVMG